jgi:neutral ceramidase
VPLYAGVAETNITPPLDIRLAGYARRSTGAVGVLDELSARALVLDDGKQRLVLVTADVAAFPAAMVTQVRCEIAMRLGTVPQAILLHATHTHNGPHLGVYRAMGPVDAPYVAMLTRKLTGVARQAAAALQPAHLTYGESSAQIGVNRRATDAEGRTVLGANYGAPVVPTVQTLCVNGADGRMFAMLFSHACHPTTLPREELRFSADWPGAAVAALRDRFQREAADSGIAADAIPMFFQGCCGDIDPLRRGDREAVLVNGRQIAEAAHTARWNAHGRLDAVLDAVETTIDLPLLTESSVEACDQMAAEATLQLQQAADRGADPGTLSDLQAQCDWAAERRERALQPVQAQTQPFRIQKLMLGGVPLLGFPAEMFSAYQLEFAAQLRAPLLVLGYANGCWNYLPTAVDYARGGYEVESACRYYGNPMFAPASEMRVREAVDRLLTA